jgi:hypothetical protein
MGETYSWDTEIEELAQKIDRFEAGINVDQYNGELEEEIRAEIIQLKREIESARPKLPEL